jgi:hypothetical protein
MSEEMLTALDYDEPIVQRETIRSTDLDLRKAAKALAKKEDTRLRKVQGSSKQSMINSAKKRIALLEREVENLGESKAELLGYVGEIANLQSWLKRLQDERDEILSERDFILMSLLNQRSAPVSEEKRVPKINSITTTMILENIWFLRSFIAGAIILGSAALLAYSFYFKQIFDSTGGVVSYFPWSWNVAITSSTAVTELYSLGVGVSLFIIGIATVGLLFFLPELIKTLTNESLSEFAETTSIQEH